MPTVLFFMSGVILAFLAVDFYQRDRILSSFVMAAYSAMAMGYYFYTAITLPSP